jgi:hypothetical protein
MPTGKRLVGILAVASVALFGTACRPDVVEMTDIAGVWTVAAASRDRLPPESRGGTGRLTLASEGAFTASEIPQELLYDHAAHSLSGEGMWRIVTDRGEPHIELSFRTISIGQRGSLPYRTELFLDRRGSTRRLFYERGDPDARDRIYFERAAPTR